MNGLNLTHNKWWVDCPYSAGDPYYFWGQTEKGQGGLQLKIYF